MLGLYIFAGIIIFFWLLLQARAGVRVIYSSREAENLKIYAQIGFYKLYIVPGKPSKAKKKKKIKQKKVKKVAQKKPEKKKVNKRKEQKKEDKRKYKIGELIGLARKIGAVLFKKIRKHLIIRVYKAHINAGASDAYKAAKLYANINQAAYYIYELLINNFNFKASDIKINPDFLGEKLNFDIDIKISMRLGAGLNILISAAIVFVKFWLSGKKNNVSNKNNIENISKESENKWQTAT